MRWWLIGSTIMMIGCSKTGRPCGEKFSLLWPDAAGVYATRVVTVPSLRDGRTLDGPAAKVYYEGIITENGFAGRPAEPHVISDGDVCVPEDTGSAVAISTYAQYDRLQAYDRQLGVADQVKWPRLVSVETRMMGAARDVLNNAHYFGERDVTTHLPATFPKVPPAMNLGVLAHEHFHAHFQTQVMNQLARRGPAPVPADQILTRALSAEAEAIDDFARMTDTIWHAWNEGLADLYAAVYTGNPRFLAASLMNPREIEARRLDADAWDAIGGEKLQPIIRNLRLRATAASAQQELTGIIYHEGSSLARVLYQVLYRSGAPEAHLRTVLARLKELPDALGSGPLDFGRIVPVILDGLPVDAQVCRALNTVLVDQDNYRRIRSCASSSPS